jgi:hypothetical protein
MAGSLAAAPARPRARRLTTLVLVGTLLWASLLYLGHRTAGVSGSDPYAYAQMAVDIARQGSPLHRFPLFPILRETGVPWYPIVHVGYALPLDAAGTAATVCWRRPIGSWASRACI